MLSLGGRCLGDMLTESTRQEAMMCQHTSFLVTWVMREPDCALKVQLSNCSWS